MDMEEETSLPHDVLGVHDALRFGLPALKQDALPRHPAETVQRTHQKLHEDTRKTMLRHLQGSAFVTKMDIEQQILSRVQRPPGLVPSSMLGLDSYNRTLESFGFEDYLNDPRDSELFTPADLHHGMEVRLGLSSGPVSKSFT